MKKPILLLAFLLTAWLPAEIYAQCVVSTSVLSNVSCNGGSDGSAMATASGGVSPYTFIWSSGATTAAVTGLVAGTYSVTITDNLGCTDDASVTITEPTAVILNVTSTNATCGACNGATNPIAFGGTAPYVYAWSNGSTTPAQTGLCAGTYSLTITDANGCTDSASVIITNGASPIVLNLNSSDPTCSYSCDGVLQGSFTSGGVTPYTYAWSNGASTAFVNSVCPGTYTLTVTDAAGCTNSGSVTLTAPSAVTATITSTSDETCAGLGSATVASAGGGGAFTYNWSNGVSGTSATTVALSAGTYSITVNDLVGCTAVVNNINIGFINSLVATATSTPIICSGAGSATASSTGGTAPFTYLWSNGDINQTTPITAAGTYTVTVTDGGGCTSTSSVTVGTSPGNLAASITVNNQISCAGGSNGSLTANVTGGTAPFQYLWNTGATTPSQTGLSAGMFIVQVIDANGCSDSDTVVLSDPGPIAIAFSVTDVSCNGGTDGAITAIPSGGVGIFTHQWTGPNGFTAFGASISNLMAGTYNITASDANGCTATGSIGITEPSAISISLSTTQESNAGACDGSASATVTGGVPPFAYTWSNATTTPSITGLCGGLYTVTVTDANGCTETDTTTITTGGGGCYTLAGSVAPISDTRVYLITESNGFLSAVDSMDITNGSYSFTNVCAGTFYVKAALLPASTIYNNFLPTYYGNQLLWSNATAIVITSANSMGNNINLSAGVNPGGPGFIGGLISQGANKQEGPGDPIANVLVLLTDANDQPVAYTFSNVDGEYEFSNLALGDYKLVVDIMNKPSEPRWITLTANETSFNAADFFVQTTEVTTGVRNIIESGSVKLYPVPTRDLLNLELQSFEHVEGTLRVINTLGQEMSRQQISLEKGWQTLNVDLQNINPGVYMLTLDAGDSQVRHSFIKN